MAEAKSTNPEREERILEAAARLIVHYGYDKTTVSDIAREAGVSKGAIYLHYDSKEELFEALIYQKTFQYSEDWLQRFENDQDEWSFISMFKLMLMTMQDHPFMVAIFKRDPQVFGSFLRRDSSALQRKGAANTQLFSMLQEVGALRADMDPPVMAYLLNIFAYGLVSSEAVVPAEQTPPFDDVIEGLGKLLDRGMSSDDGGDREAAKALVQQISQGLQMQLKQMRESKMT